MARLWQTLKQRADRENVEYPKHNPFVSRAQVRKFGAMMRRGEISKAEFDKWVKETPNIKSLPERVKRRKKR